MICSLDWATRFVGKGTMCQQMMLPMSYHSVVMSLKQMFTGLKFLVEDTAERSVENNQVQSEVIFTSLILLHKPKLTSPKKLSLNCSACI